jgi:uncharacterized protein YecE (DUF72 family)
MSSEEFDLFGEPIARTDAKKKSITTSARASTNMNTGTREKVGAAIRDDEAQSAITQLGQTLKVIAPRLHLGTSSWSFSGWAGLVYDTAHSDQMLSRHGLPAYASHPLFRTVSVDRTFYAPMSETQFRAYAKQVEDIAPDFRFLVKAPMMFTGPRLRSDDGAWSDNETFLNASLTIAQFVLPATQGLAGHCGPLVFQFPPLGPRFTKSPTRFADALAEFLLSLPKLAGDACYAVEVRDPELLTDDYLAALCAGNATHCIAIHARMPQAREQARFWREANTLPLVIRWSLHSGFKYEEAKERYAPFNALVDEDPQGRAQVATLVGEASEKSLPGFVVINNKAEGSAPMSVEALAKVVAESESRAKNIAARDISSSR